MDKEKSDVEVFLKICKCQEHNLFVKDAQFTIYHIKKSKKFKIVVLDFMRNYNLLDRRAEFLCDICYHKIDQLIKYPIKPTFPSDDGDEDAHLTFQRKVQDFSKLLLAATGDEISACDGIVWETILRTIGEKVMYGNVLQDGNQLKLAFKDTKTLASMDIIEYVENRTSFLKVFLEGLSKKKFVNLSNINKVKFAFALENIYSLLNLNWVFPISFCSNLLQSTVSGSKLVTEVNGKLSPGGSYTTYMNWLKENGSKPLSCPQGDIETYIDNIGKYVTKTYRVSKNKVESADVITTTLHINIDDGQFLQGKNELKPINWLYSKDYYKAEDTISKMEKMVTDARQTFRRCRLKYLETMVEIYKRDQNCVEERIQTLLQLQIRKCVNPVSFI